MNVPETAQHASRGDRRAGEWGSGVLCRAGEMRRKACAMAIRQEFRSFPKKTTKCLECYGLPPTLLTVTTPLHSRPVSCRYLTHHSNLLCCLRLHALLPLPLPLALQA